MQWKKSQEIATNFFPLAGILAICPAVAGRAKLGAFLLPYMIWLLGRQPRSVAILDTSGSHGKKPPQAEWAQWGWRRLTIVQQAICQTHLKNNSPDCLHTQPYLCCSPCTL